MGGADIYVGEGGHFKRKVGRRLQGHGKKGEGKKRQSFGKKRKKIC